MKQGISIIIPCYNTEKYIEKCLNSILNQGLETYEIILVDDNSKDDTVKVIKKYMKDNKKITLIENKENKGAGYNRNIALKKAKYDIISFVDSDDYLEDNYYAELMRVMEKKDADVAICDIYIKYDESLNGEQDIRTLECEGKECLKNFINTGHAASPCNKLFKKELLLQYPFPEGIMNEDIATVFAILVHAKKIAYTSDTYYNYIQRKKSVQNNTLSFVRFDLFRALEILEERIKDVDNYHEYFDIIIYQQVIMFYLYIPPKEENFKKRVKFLKRLHEESKKYNLRQNHYYWNFIDRQGTKHKWYYRMYMKLNDEGHSFLASLMIGFYKFYSKHVVKSVIKKEINMDDLIKVAKKQSQKKAKIKLSVVVPNYNYEKFLYQRIYSILYQKEKIFELIILDDCSKDNSKELIDQIVEKLQPYINIRKIYNTTNSGSAFKQWEKGFSNATGDYVWISEADDYCTEQFLTTVLKPLKKDKDITISYCDTAFIDRDGKIILKTIIPEIDILKSGHWDKPFIENGEKEIKKYAYLNCTIANVSSVVFKNDDYSKEFLTSSTFKQAGDWLFYVNIMKKGKIAFSNKICNFYRVHGNNVTSTTKKAAHFTEIKRVHEEISKMYKLNREQKKQIKERYKFLERVWELNEVKSK